MGCLPKKVMFNAKGECCDEDLRELSEQLLEEYQGYGVHMKVLIDLVVIAVWRNARAIEYEGTVSSNFAEVRILLDRYVHGNQKALLTTLAALEKLRAARAEAEADWDEQDFQEDAVEESNEVPPVWEAAAGRLLGEVLDSASAVTEADSDTVVSDAQSQPVSLNEPFRADEPPEACDQPVGGKPLELMFDCECRICNGNLSDDRIDCSTPEDDPCFVAAQADDTANTEVTPANPTKHIETPPPSIESTGTGSTVESSTPKAVESSGSNGRAGGTEALHPESVPEPDVHPSKSAV